MTRDCGRDAPDSHPDNVIPFPGSAPTPDPGDVAVAWSLVRDFGAADGDRLLTLALAVSYLCRALTPPGANEGGPPARSPVDGEDRP